MQKNLIWWGPPYSYSGYGTHNRAMIFELHKLNWNIKLIPTENHIPEHLIGKNLLLKLTQTNSINPDNTISINLVPPPALPNWSAYTILYTTLESKTVHEGFFLRCLQYDEVWLPCKANIQSMLHAGFPRKKLYHCPEGVHPQFWSDTTKPNPQYKSPYFTFFYNGDWSYRKGIDILIKAYAKAFSSSDPVRLLMLTHYQGKDPESSRQQIGTELQDICHKYSITKLPRIQFIFEHIPDPLLPSIYACANVYISPTRGEAWGLPIIQAMSCGTPPIVPEWGGQMDYCNKQNSYLTKVEKFDTIHDKVNLVVDFYWYQLFCFPDENDVANKMRYAYNHPEQTKQKGKLARQHVTKYFTWQNAAKIADKQLTKIYESRFR